MATSGFLLTFFVVAVALRLCSLLISKRNEARLRAENAEEFGAANSRLIAALHVTYYAAALIEGLWRNGPVEPITWLGVALYTFSMFILAYVIYELGNLWTVKLLLAPHHTLKQNWLFRTARHPNYYLNIIPELLGMAPRHEGMARPGNCFSKLLVCALSPHQAGGAGHAATVPPIPMSRPSKRFRQTVLALHRSARRLTSGRA